MDDWAQGRQEPKATARPHRFSPDVITLRYCSNSTIQVVAYGGSGPARTGIFKSAPYSPEELEPIFKNDYGVSAHKHDLRLQQRYAEFDQQIKT
ncbi:hypothetical protein PHLCEN_2v8755 [Hermanssonia centrifuga]|uniref:Uncharacterized protein n=1 Tax=Hermanssonia centrifuga TaxID=98765 RepID=A0A2R6NST2_9APHY|nr:hypothetical protein PHLCEN_2v8755 [Hermanssonia centrifuga]